MKDLHLKYFERLAKAEELLKSIDTRLRGIEGKIISNFAITLYIKIIGMTLGTIALWLTCLTYIIYRR